jgi:murein DD-endopeptidase MepM/ murein hydrolase activator NlpD
MRPSSMIAWVSVLLLLVCAAASGAAEAPSVSAQGIFQTAGPHLSQVSPGGTYQMVIVPLKVGFDRIRADLEVTSPDGVLHRIRDIQGNGFFLSDLGRVVVLETEELSSIPSLVRVYDLSGTVLWKGTISAPRNPVLSNNGRFFACGEHEGTVVLDLASFRIAHYSRMDLSAVGPDGILAGVSYRDGNALQVRGESAGERSVPLEFQARKVCFDGADALVLGPASVLSLPLGPAAQGKTARVLYRAAAGEELMDVQPSAAGVKVGLRRVSGDRSSGEAVTLAAEGGVLAREAGPSETLARRVEEPGPRDLIPWPIAPNSQHPVGNTYGEYQNYGGAPYPHPGIDCLGSPNQPVYAVHSGVVKAVLTTGGDWYWRVAISDSVTSGTSRGYLYAHLNQSSITVHVGDMVQVGQQIGTLVEWPGWNFTHTHFTVVEDTGTTWDGAWLSVHNPHLNLNHSETEAPVFEPARGTDLLAFCTNQTSTYLSPTALHGAVDIICHVSDRIASTWECTVQELRYSIYPYGNPGNLLVNNKLALFCDFTCDTYSSGTIDAFMINLLYKQDSVCHTQGDYDYREFYHILTNSDGDQVYGPEDMNAAWDTSVLPDGRYVIRVTAIDAAGNAKSDSMTVTTSNGNPGSVADGPVASSFISCRPNPMAAQGRIRFAMPGMTPATVSVYAPDGRLVRHVFEGTLRGRPDSVDWNGCDDAGRRLPTGMYLLRLEGNGVVRTGRVVLID